ncbi:Helix-turn-helix domain-containing protein [Spirosomataceae bacterium TFI 002]|nr:Helix-turn-helix domain-containing protein [Spirosomataceae bacterium TFI 002]
MLRVPSEIEPNQFESLKIQELTFVAYRSDFYPSRNEVFFEENAVIYVLEGKKRFSNPLEEVNVSKGDVVFIRRGFYLMSESIDESYKSLVFFFDEKLIKDFVNQHLELFEKARKEQASTLLVLHGDETFGKFIASIFPYFKSKTKFLNHFLKLKLQELLLHLLAFDNSKHLLNVLKTIYLGEKEDLKYLMNNYYLKPLSMDELAKLSGRSLSTFKRDFKEQFSTSPATWIRNKRLDQAAFLLKNQSKSVAEVSEEIGFDSVSHFIKAFKERFGKTPSKY